MKPQQQMSTSGVSTAQIPRQVSVLCIRARPMPMTTRPAIWMRKPRVGIQAPSWMKAEA